MVTEPVQLSIISATSGIIIAYIVNVLAKKVQDNKNKKQPKDRMEQMFDGYERLIKQKDAEDDRKQRYIKIIEAELAATKAHVMSLEQALEATQEELAKSREDSANFQLQLNEMRKEYTHIKKEREV